MPQPKRRKLSLDEQDGKDREKNRIAPGSDEGVEKQSTASLPKEGCSSNGLQTTQPDKKAFQQRSERKAEGATSSSMVTLMDDGKDGAVASTSSAGDVCERVSSSGRVIRQTNKGRCFTAALEAAQNKQSGSTGQAVGSTGQPAQKVGKSTTPIRKKRGRKRRAWDLWSKFEQDAFFEGLFEHGKDFDAIHNLLVFRSRKRGIDPTLIKTKDQVRHLYYRMWQKIAKHVNMGSNVKKETQEIYGLVNYYTIRKVFKRMDDRATEHLNELILKGISKVREPNSWGKKNRKKLRVLRTPVCNALKKLNNIEEPKEEFVADMPQQVTVELTPRSSAAWLRVHNLSHNPRVRFQVSVNRSLACLLDYLLKKWKGPNDRLRSSLGELEDVNELVVFPHHSYTLKPVTLAAQKATSVDLITFASYKQNILNSPPAGIRMARKGGDDANKGADNFSDGDGGHAGADHPKRMRSAKKGGEDIRQNGDNLSDGDGHGMDSARPGSGGDPAMQRPFKSNVKINLLPKLSDSTMQGLQPPCQDENAMFPDIPLFSPPPPTTTPASTNSREDAASLDNMGENSSWATNSTCDSEEQKGTDPSPDTSPHTKERVRDWRAEEGAADMKELMESATKGFTFSSCKLVTLAKLSLMLGKTAHIRLEYDWHPKSLAALGGVGGEGIVGDVKRMTNMLRRLSNLANLEYRDLVQYAKMSGGGKMSQCTLCGHLLEKASRKKATCDVATETDPLEVSVVAAHEANPQSEDEGRMVGPPSNSSFLTHLKAPDMDGVFRVPMPISLQPIQRASTQATAGQLDRPPDSVTSKFSYLAPYKRRPKKKPVVCQRSLLPKMPSSSNQLILLQPLSGAVTPVQSTVMAPVVSQVMLQSVPQPSSQQAEIAMGDCAVSSSVLPMVTSAMAVTMMSPMSSMVTTTTASSAVTSVSSSVSTTTSSQLLTEDGTSVGSMAGLLLDDNYVSSSELFGCHLDIPTIVSPSPSPVKSRQQLLAISVSPPSLTSILDISLAPLSNQEADAGDRFLEMVTNGNTGFSGLLKSPLRVECGLGEVVGGPVVSMDNLGSSPLRTPTHPSMNTPTHPMTSPSHCSPLKSGADTHWLGAEVPDLSLSEFEDSPVKKSVSSSLGSNSNGLELGLPTQNLGHFGLHSPGKKSAGVDGLGENSNSMDVDSLSLSHFLQSPMKKSQRVMEGVNVSIPMLSSAASSSGMSLSAASFISATPSLFGESSQDSLVARLDMDTAVQSVMTESSIDYSTKFERLAQHLADTTSQPNM